MKKLPLILSFLMLNVSCKRIDDQQDYMFTLEDGTYVCEEYYACGTTILEYCDCEHVMNGKKVLKIKINNEVSVKLVPEDTK